MPADVLGPLGLTVVLLAVGTYVGRAIIKFFWQLWQLHVEGDAKKDAANELLLTSLPAMSESLKALTRIVDERLTVSDSAKKGQP